MPPFHTTMERRRGLYKDKNRRNKKVVACQPKRSNLRESANLHSLRKLRSATYASRRLERVAGLLLESEPRSRRPAVTLNLPKGEGWRL